MVLDSEMFIPSSPLRVIMSYMSMTEVFELSFVATG